MKLIEIIPIAHKKMQRRGIAENRVRDAVDCPDQILPGYGGRKVAHKLIEKNKKKYLLRVVYEQSADKIVVVTTYLTSQIERYWRMG